MQSSIASHREFVCPFVILDSLTLRLQFRHGAVSAPTSKPCLICPFLSFGPEPLSFGPEPNARKLVIQTALSYDSFDVLRSRFFPEENRVKAKFYAVVLISVACVAAHAQGPAAPAATIKPGDNLVIENIPAIPAAVAEQTARYGESRSAALLSWNPVRREMLIATRFADTRQVHLVKMPGGARQQLTLFTDRVLGAAFEPTTADSFVFAKDTGDGEWYQLYRYAMHKPIFAVVGKNDPRVPWSESRQILDKLNAQGTPTWFLMANDEGHGYAKKKNQGFLFDAEVLFVEQYLLGQ
jgi:hypothetical protein